MQFRLRQILMALALTAVLIMPLELYINGPRSFLAGYDHSMQLKFETVENGVTKPQLVELLGEPKSSDRRFPNEIDYLREFESRPAMMYLIWMNGTNWYYCFGMDANGKVISKTHEPGK